MKLAIVLNDIPNLTDILLDSILDTVAETQPADAIEFLFYENHALIEMFFKEDATDLALLLMLSYDDIEISVY